MIAAAGSGGTNGDTDEGECDHRPDRPDHLVVWLHGMVHSDDDRVIDDGRLEEGVELHRWVVEVREAYPGSVAAATFPPVPSGRAPDRGTGRWLELTRVAAGIDGSGDERSFTGDTTPTSLRSLRHWAMGRLEGREVATDDVVLALSELSTNVERHGGDWLTVDLVSHGDVLVLSVTDPAVAALPLPRVAGPDEPSGRGLMVVGSLASRWGVVVRPRFKTVWAAFGTQ